MLADAAEPVFGVFAVGLATVHDAVPVAAGWARQRLADLVRLVEKIETQPEAREAGLGHRLVNDLVRGKSRGEVERFERLSHRSNGLAGAEGVERRGLGEESGD